jgi:hypothetical protein
MESIYKKIGRGIVFPEFKGGLLYMHKTPMDKIILPREFGHYTETIEKALSNVKDKNNVCYITIDEKVVCNETHRREGIHVDFNWFENLGGKHGHKKTIMGLHDGSGLDGGHNGNLDTDLNGSQYPKPGSGNHNGSSQYPKPGSGNHNGSPPATHSCLAEFNKNGGMILVSNYPGCKVYKGKFEGKIGDGGDCADIDVSGLQSEVMAPNDVYFINALGIHEPLVIQEKVNRSLLRINLHPEYVFIN